MLMNVTYEKLEFIINNSLEDALDVSVDDIQCSNDDIACSILDDIGASIWVEFEDLSFVSDYFNGESLSMCFNVSDDKCFISALFGTECSNPAMADEYTERYIEHSKFSGIWGPPNMAEPETGLMLASDFKYESEYDLGEQITQRLRIFTDERFANDLRPFIHYYS